MRCNSLCPQPTWNSIPKCSCRSNPPYASRLTWHPMLHRSNAEGVVMEHHSSLDARDFQAGPHARAFALQWLDGRSWC